MNTSPTWFKAVSVLALLWNLLGCLAFAADLQLTAEDLAKLPEAQQALYAARPAWALAATATAVLGGALGCLGLLFGKRGAQALLWLSLLGIVAQDIGLFLLVDGARLAGPTAVVMQSLVLLVGIGLVVLAHRAAAKGWLA